jgi:urocanate hydratase
MKALFPHDAALQRWLGLAGERIAFQGLPARICWIGLGERQRAGLMFNDMVRRGELSGADRDRPRPPRQRLGGQPEPRDRGMRDGTRRRLRLAAAQRAAQHRRRRDLGLAAPRRRRRHGLLAARRRRHRLRRQRAAAQRIERVLWNDPAPA